MPSQPKTLSTPRTHPWGLGLASLPATAALTLTNASLCEATIEKTSFWHSWPMPSQPKTLSTPRTHPWGLGLASLPATAALTLTNASLCEATIEKTSFWHSWPMPSQPKTFSTP